MSRHAFKRATRYENRDANESPLLEVVAKCGGTWEWGRPLDGWVYAPRGRFPCQWVPCEIKNAEGKNRFQDSQLEFFARALRLEQPFYVWRTADDVLIDLNWSREDSPRRTDELLLRQLAGFTPAR
jgi:hypothetical protein